MSKTDFRVYLDPTQFIANSSVSSEHGLANKHRFTIDIPTLPGGVDVLGSDKLRWNAISVSCPGVDMGVSQTIVAQRPRFFGIERGDQDLQISFLDSADMPIRRTFEQWIAKIWNPITGSRGYPEDYTVDKVVVWSLTAQGAGVNAEIFHDAFAYNIADLDYEVGVYDVVPTVVKFKFRAHTVQEQESRTPNII